MCLSGISLLEVDDLQDTADNLFKDGDSGTLGAHQRVLHTSVHTNELRGQFCRFGELLYDFRKLLRLTA